MQIGSILIYGKTKSMLTVIKNVMLNKSENMYHIKWNIKLLKILYFIGLYQFS